MKVTRGRWVTALPLLIFMGIGLAFFLRIGGDDPQILPSALIGKIVPEFTLPPVQGLDAPGLASTDMATGQMTLVNVFASWCVPCRDEHPLLQFISRENINNQFRVVGIDYKDPAPAALRFLGELGNPFSRVGADSNGRTAIDWGVYGVPETYVVDGAGRIVFKHVGPLNAAVVGTEILPRLKGQKK